MSDPAPDSDRQKRIKQIFVSATEIGAGGRDVFLDEACAGDAGLRGEVESWLASFTESDDFIETPVFTWNVLFQNGAAALGKQFGNYRIEREIGHGGMGAVYLAKRTDGEFEQRVALKIIRQSIAEDHMIERFRRERQILASLNHSNIAKLLDGGVSQNGEPFLVMEYIEGDAITDFAERSKITLQDKLWLFQKVCSAVAYAHRNLIVHRDIKPGNIIVTADGEPKLLDFGLAKLISEDLVNDPDQTHTEFRALTPGYASPEQISGDAITTASDVYSLGVVLYELLTGERPFQFEGKSLGAIMDTLAKSEPPLPSRLSHATGQLKGDLDNIVLTALRREPDRRYRSVENFSEDIHRYLAGNPITARPNTVGYLSAKFIRRHKTAVAAAFLIFLSLIGGVIATLWQASQAQRQKEKAEVVNEFLEQIFNYSNPYWSDLQKKGQETTVSEVLDEASRRLHSGEFDSAPEIKLELERTVAYSYLGQGKTAQSREHLEQYVVLLKRLYSEDDPRMIAGSGIWGLLLFEKGEFDEADKTYRHYLPLLRNEYRNGRLKPGILADALANYAYFRRTRGDSQEAEAVFREILELMPQLSGRPLIEVSTTRSTLASTLADQGRFDEALQTAREAVDEYRLRGDADSPGFGFSLTVLGGFLTDAGYYEEAGITLTQAETIFRKLLAPNALWLGDDLRNEAFLLYRQGKFVEAGEKAGEAERIYLDAFGKHYDHYPTVLITRGLILAKTGKADEGEKLLREAVSIRSETLPPDHYWTALARSSLGECLTIEHKFDEAQPLLETSYNSLKLSLGTNNPQTLMALGRLESFNREQNKAAIKTR